MQDNNHKKAVCPMCKNNNTKNRKHAPGHYGFSCKVTFRDPLIIQPNVTEVV